MSSNSSSGRRGDVPESGRLLQRGRQLLIRGLVLLGVTAVVFGVVWKWEVATGSHTDASLPGLLSSLLLFTAGPAGAVCLIVGFAKYLNGLDQARAEKESDDI